MRPAGNMTLFALLRDQGMKEDKSDIPLLIVKQTRVRRGCSGMRRLLAYSNSDTIRESPRTARKRSRHERLLIHTNIHQVRRKCSKNLSKSMFPNVLARSLCSFFRDFYQPISFATNYYIKSEPTPPLISSLLVCAND